MRYYRIVISDPKTGNVIAPPGFSAAQLGGATYTSYVNGQTLPGAWDVMLDIPVIDAATSQGFALVRVYGVSIAEIQQSNDLTGKNIQIFGGMQKGLPLANPAQSGQLTSGVIFQSFGNWQGITMTLDLVISPGPASASDAGGIGAPARPRNITLNWQGGQPLGPALKSALQTAFPGYTVNVNISGDIVSRQGDSPMGFVPGLEQLARLARQISRSIVKTKGYAGISIVPYGNTIEVFDGTQQHGGDPVQIAFQDMIGQPTWIQSPNISAKTVMRADLKVGKQFKLPPTVILNSADANSNLINQRATFQGGFSVVNLRHVGQYRAPTGDGWVTVIEGAPNNVVGST